MDGGWHFSYTGGADNIYEKLQSFAHTEWVDVSKETLSSRLNEVADPLGRGDVCFYGIEPMCELPQYIQDNQTKFEQFLKK
jgi:beta-1,4-mannosyl-glycoprotein beta-1,4-N-acetylglucosaminyltransferase